MFGQHVLAIISAESQTGRERRETTTRTGCLEELGEVQVLGGSATEGAGAREVNVVAGVQHGDGGNRVREIGPKFAGRNNPKFEDFLLILANNSLLSVEEECGNT